MDLRRAVAAELYHKELPGPAEGEGVPSEVGSFVTAAE